MWLCRRLTSTMCALICVAGNKGMAFITDSAQEGPNGIIVVDLASGESWRRLHDHASTKAQDLQTFLPIVEGRPFLEHQPNGPVKQGAGMGSDGIAISADGGRLYYCPLGRPQIIQCRYRFSMQEILLMTKQSLRLWLMREIGAVPRMGLNRMQLGISTPPIMNITLSFAEPLVAYGRQ